MFNPGKSHAVADEAKSMAFAGLPSPIGHHFTLQYPAGFRLTTHPVDPSGMPLISPPAMLAFTVGQNQVITGGQLRGVIGRVEAFYPLLFGNRASTVALCLQLALSVRDRSASTRIEPHGSGACLRTADG
jgi:hypothetical protein